MDEANQVKIYTAANSAQATELVNRLADQGISALVVNEDLQYGSSELMGPRAMPRIVVREADEQAAREIAQRFDHQVVEQSVQEAHPVGNRRAGRFGCVRDRDQPPRPGRGR